MLSIVPIRSHRCANGPLDTGRFAAAITLLAPFPASAQSLLLVVTDDRGRSSAFPLREATNLVSCSLGTARLAIVIPLVRISGDDLAQRLGLWHYPVLITATGIEQ